MNPFPTQPISGVICLRAVLGTLHNQAGHDRREWIRMVHPTAERRPPMTRRLIARPVATGSSLGQLAGFAAILALAGIGCSPAAVDTGGGSGGTAGGPGATGNPGTSGASGSGAGGIRLTTSPETGGTSGGSTKVCNATSTLGCKAEYPPACGDGINQPPEQCDDGNVLPGDGCNGVCQIEPNWNCPPAGACTRKIICGDGVIGPGEVCDDGNTLDGDGCNSTCTVQDPAYK